jgi:putative membrane protein
MGNYLTLQALLNFGLYFGIGIALLVCFTRLYILVTPYNEISDIRAGNVAPALSLVGAMLGFSFPLLSLSLHAVNIADFLVWGCVSGVVQLAVFKVLYMILPRQVEANNVAAGTLYFGCAVVTGLLNAFSLIP